ncbi:MAG: glucose-1-phosphate adenylyltransferase [Planctomycetes bacterium]|nr:glucose-1-phosphate adenylyltransferase [Planctomycetota bacterium]
MRPMNVLTLILAGGVGQRLHPLTANRCKPAVFFGGNQRIIDFTLMNCVLSDFRRIHLLAQCHSESLLRHCNEHWRCVSRELGEFIHLVPPPLRGSDDVYRSTADAVFRNLHLIEESRPDVVLILSGDHVYRADYRKFVAAHLEREAEVSVLTGEVDWKEASAFGVVDLAEDGRIRNFVEKPSDPEPYASSNGTCSINLGVYCFDTNFLLAALREDAANEDSSHDFGGDVLPRSVIDAYVASCPLEVIVPGGEAYWRDVGSIDSYFEASMDLLRRPAPFELRDPRWSACSLFHERVPSRQAVSARIDGRLVRGTNLVGPSVEIRDAEVVNCVLSKNVRVEAGAELEDCILFPGAVVESGAKLHRAIVEEGVRIPEGTCRDERLNKSEELPISSRGVMVFHKTPSAPPVEVSRTTNEPKAVDFDAVGAQAKVEVTV